MLSSTFKIKFLIKDKSYRNWVRINLLRKYLLKLSQFKYLKNNIIEGKVLGKRGRRRTNKSYLENIKKKTM